ncbi:MAG: Holliday junction branch migration protein RuvA [Candidatus Dasytiphilus stammeri]
MIGRIRGMIIEKIPPQILIEVSGISYEINMPMTCFYLLPQVNSEVVIFTHFLVREDAQLLFGFNNKPERTLFRKLIKVTGVGPKLALSILSSMSSQQFISAISKNEINTLMKLPGIGKKTAERLVIEMKDGLSDIQSNLFTLKQLSSVTTLPLSAKNLILSKAEIEATSALIALGYKPQEATKMIQNIKDHTDADCETLIREALRVTNL